MVITKSFTFNDQVPLNLYQEFSATPQNQIMIRNLSQAGNIYFGDSNVSESNFGGVLMPQQFILFPFMNLETNNNFCIVGDINTQVAIMTWLSRIPPNLPNENIT